jgi:uncharacterized membrane protein YphA (DoxX/SURF4 family)
MVVVGAEVAGYARPTIVEHRSEEAVVPVNERTALNAARTLSAMRVLFGVIFLFDGILKWILIEQGTMQGTVQAFGISYLSSNWVAVGTLTALGETFGGIALIAGVFQRPAAIGCSAIMFGIWGFSGFDGAFTQGTGWSFAGYTDPGGDLMLALVFLVLIFAPYAYGLASRYHLRDRFPTRSIKDRVLRFLVC